MDFATSLSEAASSAWASSMLVPAAVLLLFCILSGYLAVSGLLTPISVETKPAPYGEMTIAYKVSTGAYKNSLRIHDEVERLLSEENAKKVHVGIFYDDPESVPESELRFAVGCLLSSTSTGEPDASVLEKMVTNGFKVAVLPRQNCAVVATFPLRTSLSLYVAIYRVYPKLRGYIEAASLCAYPAIEICTSDAMCFVMPLSKQEEFFVPEFCDEQVSVATTEVGSVADAERRTSSRNSSRRSEDKRSSSSEVEEEERRADGDGDGVFVKPTKPAPRKAKPLPRSNRSSTETSLSSSFEELEEAETGKCVDEEQ